MLNRHSIKMSGYSFSGAPRRSAIRGLSIIELMIGVAIGLFVVAGGAKLLADGLMGNRTTIVEARISQDLRAATDVIARDLRRAGYWEGAHLGVTGTPQVNNYRTVSPAPSNGAGVEVTYNYSSDTNNAVDAAEFHGFQLGADNGVGLLRMKLGQVGGVDNWQPLTDPRVVNVTGFNVEAVTAEISLGDMCRGSPLGASGTPPPACCRPSDSNPAQCKPPFLERTISGYSPTTSIAPPTGTTVNANCPQLIVRRFEIVVTGRGLPPNQNVVREIRESVRVRNDEVTQVACPP
jgi:prepilin peptidase dependent protein B